MMTPSASGMVFRELKLFGIYEDGAIELSKAAAVWLVLPNLLVIQMCYCWLHCAINSHREWELAPDIWIIFNGSAEKFRRFDFSWPTYSGPSR